MQVMRRETILAEQARAREVAHAYISLRREHPLKRLLFGGPLVSVPTMGKSSPPSRTVSPIFTPN